MRLTEHEDRNTGATPCSEILAAGCGGCRDPQSPGLADSVATVAGPFGPATPGVVVVRRCLLVDEVPADLVAGIGQRAKDDLAANSRVLAGSTDDGVSDLLSRGSSGVRGDKGGCVDGVVANLEREHRLAVLPTTRNSNSSSDLAGGVGADRFAAAGLADGAVGDGDVAGVVAVALDVNDLAVGAIDEPDEIGLGGRSAGGGDQRAGDSHEGCGDDGGEPCFGFGCVHEWSVGVRGYPQSGSGPFTAFGEL